MEKYICVQCGETRESIKANKLFCATVTRDGETDHEWYRHRFKPYSAKEIAAQKRDEDEWIKQMGEMSDYIDTQSTT